MKRTAPFLLLAAGSAAILAGLIVTRFTKVSPTTNLRLPSVIAGQQLVDSQRGSEAIGTISRLHPNPLSIDSGAVGHYGGQMQVMVWASGTTNPTKAAGLVADMHEAIATGNTPFYPVGEATIDERSVYELTGMGQRHFYFQSGSTVIWLAADPEMADEALVQVMEFYHE